MGWSGYTLYSLDLPDEGRVYHFAPKTGKRLGLEVLFSCPNNAWYQLVRKTGYCAIHAQRLYMIPLHDIDTFPAPAPKHGLRICGMCNWNHVMEGSVEALKKVAGRVWLTLPEHVWSAMASSVPISTEREAAWDVLPESAGARYGWIDVFERQVIGGGWGCRGGILDMVVKVDHHSDGVSRISGFVDPQSGVFSLITLNPGYWKGVEGVFRQAVYQEEL